MGEELFFSTLKLLVALPIVILLAYISLRLTNKYLYRQNQGKNIQVLERVPIHNKSSLCVVKVFEDYMIIGVGEDNFQVIKTLNQEEIEYYTHQGEEVGFSKILSSNLKKWTKGKSSND